MAPDAETPKVHALLEVARCYVIALAIAGGAIIARHWLDPILHNRAPYILFFSAVVLVTRLFGVGPGIACLIACGAASAWFWLPPEGWAVQEPADQVALALYTALSTGLLLIVHRLRKANARLAASEEHFRLLTEGVTDYAILMLDPAGRVLTWNTGAQRIIGYSAAEILCQPFAHFYTAEAVAAAEPERALELAAREGSCSAEGWRVRKDGSRFWAMMTITALRDSTGKLRGFAKVVRDITERKLAEEALRASEARLAGVVTSAMDAIISVDAEQRIVMFNAAAEKMFRCPVALAMGQSLDRFIPERARKAHREHVRRFGETGETARQMGRLGTISGLRADGEEFPIEASISRLEIAGQKMFTVILREITERKRAEDALRESEQQFRGTFENAAVGIAHIDTEGRWLQANQKLCRMLGYLEAELKGLRFVDMTHPDDLEQDISQYRPLMQGALESYAVEKRYVRKGGDFLWVRVTRSAQLDKDGRTLYSISIIEDISARKLAEEALRTANVDAERANKAKDEFLSVLSHELRTPLTSILGWVRMLQTRDFDKTTAKKGLDVIARNVKTQTHLIEDLLDVSRIIAGEMWIERRRLDLAALVAEAITEFMPTAEAKQLTLQYSPSAAVFVDGDHARLRQVLWNLLSNATKFTPAGGHIDVSLQSQDKQAILSITDTGKGISGEFLPHLFQRFKQEDASSSRRYMGLGLGLAIVNSIVELHQGHISVRSEEEGKGTTFTIRLPLLDRQQDLADIPPRADLARSGQRLKGMKVLVVDDDPDTRELLATVLRIESAEVLAAASAAEALLAWQQFQPAILISDIGMPGEDGCVLMQKLRILEQQQGRRPMPAIALTGYARLEDVARAEAAGYQAHMAKPVEPDGLIQTIARLRAQRT